MKKFILAVLLLAFLAGCTPTPEPESPVPTASPAAEVTPTPTPVPHRLEVPMVEWGIEPWQEQYIDLLAEKEFREEARAARTEHSSWEGYYILYDMDKDSFPELLILYWEFGAFYVDLYTFNGYEAEYVGNFYCGRLPSLYSCPGENGILNDAARAGPEGETHWWRKFAMENGMMGEKELLWECIPWDEESHGEHLSRPPVSAQELVPEARVLDWNEVTVGRTYDAYQAVNIAPILDYHSENRTILHAPLGLTTWQKVYWDILTAPKKYEGFYALAEHIPSAYADRASRYWEDPDPTYSFAVQDINGDGMPELLLRYDRSHILLNILSYEEATGQVVDLDGPRAYPLWDTLGFFDTGYFSTIDGAGGLYTEFWHLEDPDPDHYWSGCERNAQFNENGELESWEEFPFSSSDGKEKFTLQEYYDLLGESGVGVEWLACTAKNIRQVFCSTVKEPAALYLKFLTDELLGSYFDKRVRHSEIYSEMNHEEALKLYYVRDLTGDGVPELFCPGPGITCIWTVQNGEVTCLGEKSTYEEIIANGGIFYHRPGAAPTHEYYMYRWLSPESKKYPEISFDVYDLDQDGEMDTFYIGDHEVTRAEWEAHTAPYFALRDMKPTGEQQAVPFLTWLENLGIPAPDPHETSAP